MLRAIQTVEPRDDAECGRFVRLLARREMRALAMGQYGHNNQPSHHVLWLLHLCGRADLGNAYVRRVIDDAYGVDFYAGDEDNGEMGAWFVLAALGLFQGRKRVIQPLFNVGVLEAIPKRKASTL